MIDLTLQDVINTAVALGLPAVILFYIKDRRKNKAETLIAEATVPHQIDLSSISAVEAHVAFVQKAFEAERASKDRQINDLALENEKLRSELASVRAELEHVRTQVDDLRGQLEQASRRIDVLLSDPES